MQLWCWLRLYFGKIFKSRNCRLLRIISEHIWLYLCIRRVFGDGYGNPKRRGDGIGCICALDVFLSHVSKDF